jgi:outer membrane autotransporter protein
VAKLISASDGAIVDVTGGGSINIGNPSTTAANGQIVVGAGGRLGLITQLSFSDPVQGPSKFEDGFENGTLPKINGNLVVQPNGVVNGVGVVNGNVATFGGFTLGDAPGPIFVNGNFTQGSTGVLGVEIGPTNYSQLIVTGTVSLSGTLQFIPVNGAQLQLGQSYSIIEAGAITGGFSEIDSGSPFISFSATLDGGDLELIAAHTAGSFAAIAQTPNQHAAGAALDQISMGVPTGPAGFLANILSNATADQVSASLDTLSGDAYPSVRGRLADESHFLRDAMLDRSHGEAGAAGADGAAVWATPFGSWGRTGGDGNAAGLSETARGFFIGADTLLAGGWRAGAVAGYSGSDFNIGGRSSSASSDNYHLGLYGERQVGGFGVTLGGAYSWHDIALQRSALIPGDTEALRANPRAGTAQVFGEASYRIGGSPGAFEPFADVAFVDVRTNGFSETGGPAALSADAATTETTFTTLGLRASAEQVLGGADVILAADAGWRHAFGDILPTDAFQIAGSQPFVIAGLPIARDEGVVEADVGVRFAPNGTLSAIYAGDFGARTQEQQVSAKVALGF